MTDPAPPPADPEPDHEQQKTATNATVAALTRGQITDALLDVLRAGPNPDHRR